MEKRCPEPPTCFGLDTQEGSDRIAIGFVDGVVQMAAFDIDKKSMTPGWTYQMKRPVRAVQFSHDGTQLITLSQNRALCTFDVETGKRVRCVREAHDDKPTKISLVPYYCANGMQFATADESGHVKTWDMRAAHKQSEICAFTDQEDVINALTHHKHHLLAASADGTLGAYDLRKCKLHVRSEAMHSDLLSIALTDQFCYVGAGDGHIEVFKIGEYGNLLERLETGHETVDDLLVLRKGLLITASCMESKLRLLHVNPTKRMGYAGEHGEGIDQLGMSADKSTIVSMNTLEHGLMFWKTEDVAEKVPILRASEIKNLKKNTVKPGFFDDLVEKEDGDDDEGDVEGESGEEDSDVEEGSDDEEGGEESGDDEGMEEGEGEEEEDSD